MAPVVTTVSDNYAWATLFLNDLGVPASQNNINNVLLWMAQEEPASVWSHNNDPLNSHQNAKTYTYGGMTNYYYDTIAQSASETANLIALNKTGMYKGIYDAFSSNAPTATLSAAILSSPWGTKTPLTGTNVPKKYPYVATFTGLANSSAGATPSANTNAAPGCAAKGDLLNLGIFKITGCQGKALLGGLFVVAGSAVMLIGLSFVIKSETLNSVADKFARPSE